MTDRKTPPADDLDAGGELKYEHVALDPEHHRVYLSAREDEDNVRVGGDWTVNTEAPHITQFSYDVIVDNREERLNVGVIDGYILSSDGRKETIDYWEEADALDSDIEAYVTCLKLELQAVDEISGLAPSLEWFTRIVIVRHFQAAPEVDSIAMIVKAVAMVAMKEGPTLLMVDPREMPEFRKASSGKLKGRSHTASLMAQLGMVRMISCRSVWGWHVHPDTMSNEYSYSALVSAKAEGRLDRILDGLTPDEE
jgi:hypothetical protein